MADATNFRQGLKVARPWPSERLGHRTRTKWFCIANEPGPIDPEAASAAANF